MRKLLLTLLLVLSVLLCACNQGPTPGQEEPTKPELEENKQPPTIEQRQDSAITELLARMSLEQKVGQLFIARFPASDQANHTLSYQPGGYIFFANDFKHRDMGTFTQLVDSCSAVAQIPLFLGVDEEGGSVSRIGIYSQYRAGAFPSPQQLYSEGGIERIIADTAEKAQLLKALHLNLNFAPVADISDNSSDYIYPRTFGKGGAATAEYVQAVVETMNEENVGSVIKHFPGYGNNTDTHGGIAYDNRSLESFRENDFLPFSAGINSNASMVLVSHNIATSMDAELPASLSPAVHQLLRKELGFEGVIITDDLIMGAIRDYSGQNSPAVAAILAGNDMICTSSFVAHYDAVLAAAKDGTISEQQIEAALRRILKLKMQLGIINIDE